MACPMVGVDAVHRRHRRWALACELPGELAQVRRHLDGPDHVHVPDHLVARAREAERILPATADVMGPGYSLTGETGCLPGHQTVQLAAPVAPITCYRAKINNVSLILGTGFKIYGN